MRAKVIALSPSDTVKEALAVINTNRIVLVFDGGGNLLGTVTDGDIRRALLKGLDLEAPLEKVYHRDPITCPASASREHLLRVALEHEIYQIPLVDEKGKVVAIELIEDLLKPGIRPNRVVIMAGGLGTRLRPLTDDTPKPLLKIDGKPILEKIVVDFVRQGFRKITLCVNYKAEMIEEYFGDGSRFNAQITYLKEDKRLGTAGALSALKEEVKEPMVVMNGDILTNLDFGELLKFHLTQNAVATMGVREYEVQVPYGVVKVDGTRITGIDEKPLHTFYISSGIYVLSPEALDYIPSGCFYDMPELFERLIAERRHCAPYPIREYWLDIGNINDFRRANESPEIARIMMNYRRKERD